MLDPNHPSSQHIFQASVYIDRIKGDCYDYVLMDFTERQAVFNNMIATAEELLDFSETVFPESYEKISQLTEELIAEINKLQVMNEVTEAGRCKVCNGELSFFKTIHKGEMTNVPLCHGCSRPLIRKASELERPTGVWAI
jgi:hypothetical protein